MGLLRDQKKAYQCGLPDRLLGTGGALGDILQSLAISCTSSHQLGGDGRLNWFKDFKVKFKVRFSWLLNTSDPFLVTVKYHPILGWYEWSMFPHRFHIGDNLILDVPRNFAADYQNTTHFTLVRRLSQDEESWWAEQMLKKIWKPFWGMSSFLLIDIRWYSRFWWWIPHTISQYQPHLSCYIHIK